MAEAPFLSRSPQTLTLTPEEDEEEIEDDPIPFWYPLHSWSSFDHPRFDPDPDPTSLFPDDDDDDDDFFIGRRPSFSSSSSAGDSTTEFSRARPVDDPDYSDPDPGEQIVVIGDTTDTGGPPLCWDCLRIEAEDVEWEQVADELERNPDLGDGDVSRNIEWEVLLSVRNNNENTNTTDELNLEDAESYDIEDQEGFIYTSEYDEVLFGQFAEHESLIRGSPPAAKSVVENLPTLLLKMGDCCNCAVCKDEIETEEKARRLPCGHCYHEECILQWLGIRNTCPLCRFELPTDDPEYEGWKVQRAREEELRVRYDFEMLPEA